MFILLFIPGYYQTRSITTVFWNVWNLFVYLRHSKPTIGIYHRPWVYLTAGSFRLVEITRCWEMKPAVASSLQRTRVMFSGNSRERVFWWEKITLLRKITGKPLREIVKLMANHFWVWLTVHGLNCPIPLLEVSRPPDTEVFVAVGFFFLFRKWCYLPIATSLSSSLLPLRQIQGQEDRQLSWKSLAI